MPRGPKLSRDMRELCVKKAGDGMGYRTIAKELHLSQNTVKKLLSRARDRGHVESMPRTGRPPVTDERIDRAILRAIRSNRRLSSSSLQADLLQHHQMSVSESTIRNRIKAAGYNGRVARRKPFVSVVNRRKRLDYANSFDGPCLEQWRKTVFTDESPFYVGMSGARVYMWRKPDKEYVEPALAATFKKGGGCVMVWGAFGYNGVGPLRFLEGAVNANYYQEIVREAIPECREKLQLEDQFFFLQDGAPCHTARTTMALLEAMDVETLEHPPQSPDLNPIEHLWAHIGHQLLNQPSSSRSDLQAKIQAIWDAIPLDYIHRLVDSMSRRIRAVKDAKGGPTKY